MDGGLFWARHASGLETEQPKFVFGAGLHKQKISDSEGKGTGHFFNHWLNGNWKLREPHNNHRMVDISTLECTGSQKSQHRVHRKRMLMSHSRMTCNRLWVFRTAALHPVLRPWNGDRGLNGPIVYKTKNQIWRWISLVIPQPNEHLIDTPWRCQECSKGSPKTLIISVSLILFKVLLWPRDVPSLRYWGNFRWDRKTKADFHNCTHVKQHGPLSVWKWESALGVKTQNTF